MDGQRRQLEDLLDLLNIQQDKVNNFRQEIEINANPEIRFQIQQRVKIEVVPRLPIFLTNLFESLIRR